MPTVLPRTLRPVTFAWFRLIFNRSQYVVAVNKDETVKVRLLVADLRYIYALFIG